MFRTEHGQNKDILNVGELPGSTPQLHEVVKALPTQTSI